MGKKDLSQMLRPSNVSTSKFSELKDKGVSVLGVDAMMWLHNCLHRSSEVVDDFHCQPPISISMQRHIWSFLTERKSCQEFSRDIQMTTSLLIA